ncbi:MULTISPECIES: ABC transporter permease [Cupriavidus]|uniref:Spermidine/putrescine transport system permease protein ABC Transporter permease protein n=1 Tax=Cupriavidus taiwanensis TaxID=164546 RepID=A0A375FGV4_9BURK|nr:MULTISPECIES: ABC transporter permease [Cupriavidus]MEC3766995.1 ABC transporter permease [Cupriavidus sp. SS-3]SOY92692.1 Spermidine/putrescine transport system permease; protein ABC Transporter permease protein [Cupriavidus taiwanensis]SOY98280.1 Spermidine/putrescine transport system permease; protein ABC Transporter permease protein [Cupriavidus taiwanensis]SPA55731.1 Spermidine/putrescine transport system permease; protein ABC Transporter permease protein [Cupriavidus taiwanensis]SPD67
MRKNGPLSLLYHAFFIAFMVAPLLVVVAVSFTGKGYISMPTDGLSLRWFRAIADAHEIVDAIWLSLTLGLVSATIAVALAVPAALALIRHRFPGRGALMAFFLSPLMIPHVVLGVAFLRFFTTLGVTGSFFWLALTHVVVVMPYALRLVLAAATGLDRDAERAALSLGASRFTAFRRVVLPLILPGVVGGWMLSFIQSFDELTMTVFVATPGTTTLPVAMYNQIAQTIDPLVASVSTVLIVGTLVLMVLLDRIVGLDRVLIGKN